MDKGSYPSPEEASGASNGPYPRNHQGGVPSTQEELDINALRLATSTGHHHGTPSGAGHAPDPTSDSDASSAAAVAAAAAYQHQGLYAQNPYGQPPHMAFTGGVPQPGVSAVAGGHDDGAALRAAQMQFQPPTTPGGMAMRSGSPGSDENAGAAKKKKASRACDECRRKKIKCDKTEDNDEPCSNCRRVNSNNCTFTRVQQKRGPSKGYIKELADRVTTLENRNPGPALRKRTHSMSEDLSILPSPLQSNVSQVAPMAPIGGGENASIEGPPSMAPLTAGELSILQAYDKTVHATLPFLSPHQDVQTIVSACSAQLRRFFFEAIRAACTPFPDGNSRARAVYSIVDQIFGGNLQKFRPLSHTYTANVLYLQGLAFLVLAVGFTGPEETLPPDAFNQHGLLLHGVQVVEHLTRNREVTGVAPAVYNMGRRVYWVLGILDCLRAVGQGSQSLIIHQNMWFQTHERSILDAKLFHLAEMCPALSILANESFGPAVPLADRPHGPGALLVETWLMSIESIGPAVGSFHRTIRLFTLLEKQHADWRIHFRDGEPDNAIREATEKLVNCLFTPDPSYADGNANGNANSNVTPISSPLGHYFLARVVNTLILLTDTEIKDDAALALHWTTKKLNERRGEDETWQNNAWLGLIANKIDEKLNRMAADETLRELADAAVNRGESEVQLARNKDEPEPFVLSEEDQEKSIWFLRRFR